MRILILIGLIYALGGVIFDKIPALQIASILALGGAGAIIAVSPTRRIASIDLSPFGVLIFIALATTNSMEAELPLSVAARYLALALVYISIRTLINERLDPLLFGGIFLSTTAFLCAALLFSEFDEDIYRRSAFGIHPNLIALNGFALLIISSYLDLSRNTRILSAVLAIGVALAFSSRAALLASSIFIILQYGSVRALLRPKNLTAAALIATISAWLLWPSLSKALLLDDEYRGYSSGFSGRTSFWEIALNEFQKSPLFGMGYGLAESTLGIPIDNGYVLMLTETGVLGMLVFLLLAAHYFAMIGKSPPQGKTPRLATAAAVSFLVYLIFERRYLAFGNILSLTMMGIYCRLISNQKMEAR